jgi:hypothetical protein
LVDLDTTEREESEDGQDTPKPNRWLVDLFFVPSRFFRHYVVQETPGLTGFAFYLYGLANAHDRMQDRLMRGDVQSTGGDWATYWFACLVVGLVSAALIYGIGGWWYRKRLEFSGAVTPDSRLARRVYVFASLVWAIPSLAYAAWQSAAYDTPIAAALGDDLGWGVILVFLLWSVLTSYRGATTAFPLRAGAARMWFLILPATIYALLFGGFFLAAFSGLLAQRPDVQRPNTVIRQAFQLQYPGNWVIDTSDPDYDLDSYFSIEPPLADCVVSLHVGTDFVDAADGVEAYCAALEEAVEIDGWQPLTEWGALTGEGRTATGSIGGVGEYLVVVFAAEGPEHVLVARELCASNVHSRIAPGISLIRRSFTWR